MNSKILVRIEYNEIEGDFHYEQNPKSERNDNDYNTISESVDSDLAYEFGEMITEKYPALNERKKEKYPSFTQMKIEFQNFIVAKSSNLL